MRSEHVHRKIQIKILPTTERGAAATHATTELRTATSSYVK
jgi:hypothetical protein